MKKVLDLTTKQSLELKTNEDKIIQSKDRSLSKDDEDEVNALLNDEVLMLT